MIRMEILIKNGSKYFQLKLKSEIHIVSGNKMKIKEIMNKIKT
jgi:hypothetical protein